MREKLPAPKELAGRGASAALHGWSVVPPRPAPRALHPLPLPANAAHAEYSDRLLSYGRVGTRVSVVARRVVPSAGASGPQERFCLADVNFLPSHSSYRYRRLVQQG